MGGRRLTPRVLAYMIIEILQIDRRDVVPVAGGRALGYRGQFRSSLISGSAVLVPYTKGEQALLAGNCISVETSQESVSEFRFVSPELNPCIRAIDPPGDYAVVGTIILNTGDYCFDIEVEELTFALDDEDTNGRVPEIGQRVAFVVHGLSLWDENI